MVASAVADECLSWRSDPDKTHADLKITVTYEEDNGTTSSVDYNLHQCIVTFGPRKAKYFSKKVSSPSSGVRANLLQCLVLPEIINCDGELNIRLPKEAAQAVPVMLDFVYGALADSALQVNVDNAVPLLYLGRKFGVQGIEFAVMCYLKDNMSIANCHVVHRQSRELLNKDGKEDEAVKNIIIHACANELDKYFPSVEELPILKVTNCAFWIEVLKRNVQMYTDEAAELSPDKVSEVDSYTFNWVSAIMKIHKHDLNTEEFHQLTSYDCMPTIYCEVDYVIGLLSLEESFVEQDKKLEGLTVLQQRCLNFLADTWDAQKEGHEMKEEWNDAMTYLSKRPELVKYFFWRTMVGKSYVAPELKKQNSPSKNLPKDSTKDSSKKRKEKKKKVIDPKIEAL